MMAAINERREARRPYFNQQGLHYLVTSGTTGYCPNPSEVAVAVGYHGPWTVLNDTHPEDPTRSSYQSDSPSAMHPSQPLVRVVTF